MLTGFGAVANTAKVEPGTTVAVFGTGGIGLNVVQAAALSGAARIIAIDTNPAKLELARAFGATDVLGADESIVRTLRKMTGGGVDYAFECVGSGVLAGHAYGALGKGGMAVIVGVAPSTDNTTFRSASMTFEENTITGSYFGTSRPRFDIPRILDLHLAGKLKLEELITRRYTIEEAAQAFDDLAAGRNARGVIVFS